MYLRSEMQYDARRSGANYRQVCGMKVVCVRFIFRVWTEPHPPDVFSFPCPHEVTQIYSRVIDFSSVGGLITIIFDVGIYSHSNLQCNTLYAFYHVLI